MVQRLPLGSGMAETIETRRPVRLRKLCSREGAAIAPVVFCPREGRSIDAVACTRCPRMRAVEWHADKGGAVVCAPETTPVAPADPRADVAEVAARSHAHELVEAVTLCVSPTARVAEVRELFARKALDVAPVVDGDWRLVGLVSCADLAGASPDSLVRDVMAEPTDALPETAPVGSAIALMAFEEIVAVPVVSDKGELVGLLRALSALRWTAERLGYVGTVPSPRRARSRERA